MLYIRRTGTFFSLISVCGGPEVTQHSSRRTLMFMLMFMYGSKKPVNHFQCAIQCDIQFS